MGQLWFEQSRPYRIDTVGGEHLRIDDPDGPLIDLAAFWRDTQGREWGQMVTIAGTRTDAALEAAELALRASHTEWLTTQ